MKPVLLLSLLLLPVALPAQKIVDPMDMAESLAKGKFKGYVYKAKGVEKSIDCTEFVLAVATEYAERRGETLTSAQKQRLVVAGVDKAKLQALVDKDDASIRGVQQALVDAGLGKVVEPSEAMHGDLIQYWYKSKGKWLGHAGIIQSVRKDGTKKAPTFTLTVFGSHKSKLTARADGGKEDVALGGIGPGPRLQLPSDSYKVYIVRWTKTAKKPKKG